MWFRKGVVSLEAGTNEASATGNGWVSMMHRMRTIAVGTHDQVSRSVSLVQDQPIGPWEIWMKF